MIRENTEFPLDAIKRRKRPFPSPTRIWQNSVSDRLVSLLVRFEPNVVQNPTYLTELLKKVQRQL